MTMCGLQQQLRNEISEMLRSQASTEVSHGAVHDSQMTVVLIDDNNGDTATRETWRTPAVYQVFASWTPA